MKGDNIPVSEFTDLPDGTMPQGTSKYEKEELQSIFLFGTVKMYPVQYVFLCLPTPLYPSIPCN